MTEPSSAADAADPEDYGADLDDPMLAWHRCMGALLGLAVGDALGVTLAGSKRDSRPLLTEMRGRGPYELSAGTWTDNTAMAVALGESIVKNRGLDPTDLMQRFSAWMRHGAYSPIGATLKPQRATPSTSQASKHDAGPHAVLPQGPYRDGLLSFGTTRAPLQN